jgi:Bor protein
MRSTRMLALCALAATLAGCYHATIETGAKPSTVTLEKRWASAWIDGLVAPKTVETASKCPSGVAKVETQLSFVNMLVGILTLGIYTPMDIRVTCAEAGAGMSLEVPAGDSAAVAAILGRAALDSREQGRPVFVTLTH